MGNDPASGTDPSGYHWGDTINYLTNGPAAQFITNQDTGYEYEGATVALQTAAAYVTPFNPFWGGVLKGLSYATAATAGYLETGTIRGAVLSAGEVYAFNEIGDADQAGAFSSFGDAAPWVKAGAEGFTGGAFSAAGGGKFSAGFAGSFVGSLGGSYIHDGPPGVILTIALGGTTSELSGGTFANGAISAAFAELFNACMHGGCGYSGPHAITAAWTTPINGTLAFGSAGFTFNLDLDFTVDFDSGFDLGATFTTGHPADASNFAFSPDNIGGISYTTPANITLSNSSLLEMRGTSETVNITAGYVGAGGSLDNANNKSINVASKLGFSITDMQTTTHVFSLRESIADFLCWATSGCK
jgi:hypothetical protein